MMKTIEWEIIELNGIGRKKKGNELGSLENEEENTIMSTN